MGLRIIVSMNHRGVRPDAGLAKFAVERIECAAGFGAVGQLHASDISVEIIAVSGDLHAIFCQGQ